MIVGLSRAVNRLSRGTEAVRRGDFGVRIPVRRRDQVGDLQRSFNEMAGNLESLVATAAQKESLEKELELARNLQKSLLPGDLPAGGGIEFSTLFEPSAAIGGDYFDVLRLADDELAVIIADVSGHGLSSGLRMAMLKAALLILVEETREPEEILSRLDAVVRSNRERRFFVTATLGLFNARTGLLRLTNAGHPPTYRVRGAEVEEILLPSSPLGGLGHRYVKATLQLAPGDSVVWLSDGLIEATNAADEPFGYDSVKRTLAGIEGESAVSIRNRLLAAVEAHTAGHPPADDRTLMVMRWGALITPALFSRPLPPPAPGEEGETPKRVSRKPQVVLLEWKFVLLTGQDPISGAESSGSGAETSSLSRRDQQLWRWAEWIWRRDIWIWSRAIWIWRCVEWIWR
jgi:sigma-B regulation protein RsbU (phosphoserine phosphatase)